MAELYHNSLGKTRTASAESELHSSRRKAFFDEIFLPLLLANLKDKGITDILFPLVGSVRKNAAGAESDIDFTYKPGPGFSGESWDIEPKIRGAIAQIIRELQEQDNLPYQFNFLTGATAYLQLGRSAISSARQ